MVSLMSCYKDAFVQLIIVSVTVFAGPGMFNALNSIGLGGDPSVGTMVACCLYGTWMLTTFFAPTAVRFLGAKWALSIGTVCYPLYALAMYLHCRAVAVLAGVLLGLGAGLLWTAQGQLMMSYPSRDRVAKYIAVFWTISNSGGLIGCLMSAFINLSNSEEGPQAVQGTALSAATYWTFFSIMIVGFLLSLAVLPLSEVTRTVDGSVESIVVEASEDAASGMKLAERELKRTLKSFGNPSVMLFIPLFFYSNFFYSYHFAIIGELFNGRTGSLVAASYWLAQILGSILLQAFLDSNRVSIKVRAYSSFAFILVYLGFTWILGGFVQYNFRISSDEPQALDWASHLRSPWLAMLALFLWGFVDSFVQIWSYWVMSHISSDPGELACLTAFYKLWQNAGAFVSFLLPTCFSWFLLEDAYWLNISLICFLILPTFLGIRSIHMGSADVMSSESAGKAVDEQKA